MIIKILYYYYVYKFYISIRDLKCPNNVHIVSNIYTYICVQCVCNFFLLRLYSYNFNFVFVI